MNTFTKLLLAGTGAIASTVAVKQYLRQSRRFDWHGRTVILTGASRGLGLVMARQLVDQGAFVAICARSETELRTAEEQLLQRGGKVLARQCDVTDPAAVRRLVEATCARFGTVDVLINNAGVIEVGPWELMTDEDFQQAMQTHCWGVLNTVREVVPVMKAQSWGRILNVASIGGKRAVPHLLPYAASKFALVGLSTGLRTELAKDGILVTTVNPGLMRTGSPHNAIFKGQHRQEYTWFSISDSLPVISMDAETAAEKILKACQNGESEATIFGPLSFTIKAAQLMPNITSEILMLVNRILPKPNGIGSDRARGYQSHSSWSPSLLTKLSEKAAVRNNELGDSRHSETLES